MPENLSTNEIGEIKNIPVKSFETEMGSVYTYDSKGKTTRFKTVDKTEHDKKDITIFLNLNPEEDKIVIGNYRNSGNLNFSIAEVQEDGKEMKAINKREDIKNINNLRFGILDTTKKSWVLLKKASLIPKIGYTVYEVGPSRKGKDFIQGHLGHKVTKINY